ncbi:conserved hypothetical protein [Ricinus communis]|uniref:Uncharacterized protein n=1 Tax=Ricinus communis TaxID=3988 RepID=B9TAY5_RICCO|nr:conserved hypothetical protein [Ricinus communis]
MKRQGTMHSSRAGLSRVRGPIRSTSDRFTEQGVQVKLLACYKLGSGTAVSRFPCSRQLVLDRSDRVTERGGKEKQGSKNEPSRARTRGYSKVDMKWITEEDVSDE